MERQLTEEECENFADLLRNYINRQADEIERLKKIVECLAMEVADPYWIAADVIKAAEEQACSS